MSSKEEKAAKQPKFKESMNVSTKPLVMLFCCAVVVCSVLRALQMAKYIDPETGFYTGGSVLKIALYAILGVCALIFFVVSYVSKDSSQITFYNAENKSMAFVSALMGFTMFYDCYDSLSDCVKSAFYSNSSSYTTIMSSGTLPSLLQSFFALFSGVFFLILAKDLIKGKASASKRKVLATMPVWWAGARLIHHFVRQISFVEVSDLFLELLMLAAMLLFFMALAQVVTGVYSDGFRWRLFAFGYIAALIALAISLPRLIFSFISSGAFINSLYTFNLADLVFAIFAFTLILSYKSQTVHQDDEGLQGDSDAQTE